MLPTATPRHLQLLLHIVSVHHRPAYTLSHFYSLILPNPLSCLSSLATDSFAAPCCLPPFPIGFNLHSLSFPSDSHWPILSPASLFSTMIGVVISVNFTFVSSMKTTWIWLKIWRTNWGFPSHSLIFPNHVEEGKILQLKLVKYKQALRSYAEAVPRTRSYASLFWVRGKK